MATGQPDPTYADKQVDEDLDRLERYLARVTHREPGVRRPSPGPYTDQSHRRYIEKEFTPEEFMAWFRVQGLGSEPFNAVGIHHTGSWTSRTWRGITSLHNTFRWYNTAPAAGGPSDGPWPWGVGPHLWLYDGAGPFASGQPLIYVATHPAHDGIGIIGRNYRWLHIEAIGTFDQARMSAAMEEVYRFVLQVICGERIPLDDCATRQVDGPARPLGLLFHRDAPRAGKSCPGWTTTADWFYHAMRLPSALFQTSAQPAPVPGWYVVIVDSANVRQGPGQRFPIAGTLPRDTLVDVNEATVGEPVGGNAWWVHLRNGQGWAHSSLLRARDVPPEVGDTVTPDSSLLAAPRATLAQAQRYLLSRPHGVYSDDDARWIARLYFETAQPVGLDPLLPVAQMVHETDFLNSHWSQPPRRNPAGIGVTGEPGAGVSFPNWTAAVRAHVGRLLAYALPVGRETEAQRVVLEEALVWRPLPARYRGCAPTLNGLTGTWAVDPAYADTISAHANRIRSMTV